MCNDFCYDGDCEQCSPYWVRGPKLCDLPRKNYRWDEKSLKWMSIRPEKKVVSQEEREKFMKEQLKIVSKMGRKFYKGRENINEFRKQNKRII